MKKSRNAKIQITSKELVLLQKLHILMSTNTKIQSSTSHRYLYDTSCCSFPATEKTDLNTSGALHWVHTSFRFSQQQVMYYIKSHGHRLFSCTVFTNGALYRSPTVGDTPQCEWCVMIVASFLFFFNVYRRKTYNLRLLVDVTLN